MKQRLAVAATVLAAFSAPALAGSPDTAVSEPVVAAPVVAAPTTGDWTGFYVGGQLGYGMVETEAGATLEGDGGIGGIFAGYDYDMGNFVIGAGIDYDVAAIDIEGAAELESVMRLKGRLGVDLGANMAYGTAGYVAATTDNLGDGDGYFFGAGYEYRLTDSLSMGGELLYHVLHEYDDSNIDVHVGTLQLRAAYRF